MKSHDRCLPEEPQNPKDIKPEAAWNALYETRPQMQYTDIFPDSSLLIYLKTAHFSEMTSDSFSGRDINETILPSQDDCIPSILLNSLFLLPKND